MSGFGLSADGAASADVPNVCCSGGGIVDSVIAVTEDGGPVASGTGPSGFRTEDEEAVVGDVAIVAEDAIVTMSFVDESADVTLVEDNDSGILGVTMTSLARVAKAIIAGTSGSGGGGVVAAEQVPDDVEVGEDVGEQLRTTSTPLIASLDGESGCAVFDERPSRPQFGLRLPRVLEHQEGGGHVGGEISPIVFSPLSSVSSISMVINVSMDESLNV
jgi:hypothetical protein